MANYDIQQIDIDMLKANYSTVWIKLCLANIYEKVNGETVFNSDFKTIADISGELIGGNYSCDSTSDIRRTLNLDFFVKNDDYDIGSNKNIWINKFIIAYIGVSNFLVENIRYYPLGVYIINSPNYSYSADSKSLSISCTDLVSLLNGDRNGIVYGALTTKIECVPKICNAEATINTATKTVLIDIINDSYNPLNLSDEEAAPYFDCKVGFNITSSALKTDNYSDYEVLISINGFKSYKLKNLTKTGETIYFSDLQYNQDYICNFEGTSSDDYCFVFYGKPNTISGAMTSVIEQFTPFNYIIENIGADVTNIDGSNPTYIPYDLEFSTGVSKWEIITKLRDLYSGWQAFFDVYGTFICNKIPTCEGDDVVLDETLFDDYNLVLSESSTYDFTSVKNFTEVWGKCQETDRYDDVPEVEFDDINQKVNIYLELPYYACDLQGAHNDPYVYTTTELLGFTMPEISEFDREKAVKNNYSVYCYVNYKSDKSANLDTLPPILLIDDYTNKNLTGFEKLLNNTGYCIQPKYYDGTEYMAVFCGEFQIHAICMLVDNEPTEEQKKQDKITYNCHQISYMYNSNNITYVYNSGNVSIYTGKQDIDNSIVKYIEDDCPYTINKIGIVNQSLSGEDYEQIYTSDLARQRAEYEAWKAGRLTDSLTIETRLIPFLDVNKKINYKSIRTGKVDTYIIDKISHSFNNFTTTIEMHKFYPTYPYVVTN